MIRMTKSTIKIMFIMMNIKVISMTTIIMVTMKISMIIMIMIIIS